MECYGTLPHTPQGTLFLDLFNRQSSAKFLQNFGDIGFQPARLRRAG
jgi:hypothetical protein